MYRSLAMDPLRSGVGVVTPGGSPWLRRFHDGDPGVIEEVYREHFATVARAVGSLLGTADRETAIHEIFLRLLSQPALRASFREGDLGAWLTVIARNHAIDCARRRAREVPAGAGLDQPSRDAGDSGEAGAHARVLVERFRKEILPAKWARVFEARFLRQLTQEEAAETLGIGRTTLAYQEARVRNLLRKFLLRGSSR
jgi:RNA polymerase sigma-70 factor (ECF subfamily)